MTAEEIDTYINNWLPSLSMYGQFMITPYDLSLDHAESIIGYEHPEVKRHREAAIVLQNMVDRGFATLRYDIQSSLGTYAQLSEMGRELKQCGSISEFDRVQDRKVEAMVAQQTDRRTEIQRNNIQYRINVYQFGVNVCIAIATLFAAIYSILEILRIQYHLGLPFHISFQ